MMMVMFAVTPLRVNSKVTLSPTSWKESVKPGSQFSFHRLYSMAASAA
ncbi:hypothetical protein ES705_44051 [subsurface metagenome]